MAAYEEGDYPLHRCIFSDDRKRLSQLLRSKDVGAKDKYGNTPLHLAVMLGRRECIHLLLNHGAPVKVKNNAGWSPLSEAISFGDRQILSSLLRKLKQQSREQVEERRPNLVAALHSIDDFYMELKWDFQSWVPLVSRILPSDICKIHKRGSSMRLDTTLVDFNDMKWERGDISFIFNGEQKPSQSLTVLDNKEKLFQRVRYENIPLQETEMELEDEVDLLMSSDIIAVQMSTKSISFSRAQSGWFFKEDRKESVGAFSAEFYHVNGMVLESRKRREHLTEEDLRKNKAIVESFTKGGTSQVDINGETIRRPSLAPPPPCALTWEEYVASPGSNPPVLGRDMVYKQTCKSFKATVAMSSEFPLSVGMLLNVLEIVAPFKHFTKLREFVNMKLPPGFPVKIDIPILPTVTAKITFQQFDFKSDIPRELFEVPANYHEDPTRFPDL
ncbi:ankyrin repeat domain-containing protein 13C-B isoform X1 [Cloeon dipterum]|uniref:ankyrin repeat domain-containing protein 13C-B isoform X1 n=1 Tax=Cloeon dipterum TaxID=197152 RepID=UPI0032201EDF